MDFISIALLVLSVYVIIYAMVFTHELGHLLVARALGLKTFELGVGKGNILRVSTDSGFKWSFGFNPLYGGVATDLSETNRWKNICVYAAGPAVNACFSLVGAALMIFGSTHPSSLLVFFTFANVGVVIENMLPYGNTDGKNILNQLKGNTEPLRAVAEVETETKPTASV